jgi:TonB family protein
MSALVHGGAIGLILFFSYAADSMVKESPKVFELVAGAGNNYAARAAPALGSPGGVKLQAPAPVAPAPPAPKAEPSPIQSAPETAPAKPSAAKPVDLVASLKRAELRREKKLEAKYQKEKEAEEKREAAEARKVAHVDAEGIRDGVLGGSAENKAGGAGGKALTREEGSELEAYFALLKNRIKEYPPPEGMADNLSARIEFFVAADGSISQVRILHSSGNAEFDHYVIEACEHTHSIGPRPDGKSDAVQFVYSLREDESS